MNGTGVSLLEITEECPTELASTSCLPRGVCPAPSVRFIHKHQLCDILDRWLKGVPRRTIAVKFGARLLAGVRAPLVDLLLYRSTNATIVSPLSQARSIGSISTNRDRRWSPSGDIARFCLPATGSNPIQPTTWGQLKLVRKASSGRSSRSSARSKHWSFKSYERNSSIPDLSRVY